MCKHEEIRQAPAKFMKWDKHEIVCAPSSSLLLKIGESPDPEKMM